MSEQKNFFHSLSILPPQNMNVSRIKLLSKYRLILENIVKNIFFRKTRFLRLFFGNFGQNFQELSVGSHDQIL